MEKRPAVDPTFIFGVSLIVSLVLWYPTLKLMMHGDIDVTDAGIRYFLALAVSWAGVYGVCSIIAMYNAEPRRPTPPPPAVAAPAPRRRREDTPPPAEESQPDAA